MKKLSIVVPVYYNKDSLAILLQRLLVVEQQLLEKSIGLELIFVDDGSGDDSLPELLRLKENHPDIRIIKLTRNFGAVHASKTGCRFVTGDCFMIAESNVKCIIYPANFLIYSLSDFKTVDNSLFSFSRRI